MLRPQYPFRLPFSRTTLRFRNLYHLPAAGSRGKAARDMFSGTIGKAVPRGGNSASTEGGGWSSERSRGSTSSSGELRLKRELSRAACWSGMLFGSDSLFSKNGRVMLDSPTTLELTIGIVASARFFYQGRGVERSGIASHGFKWRTRARLHLRAGLQRSQVFPTPQPLPEEAQHSLRNLKAKIETRFDQSRASLRLRS